MKKINFLIIFISIILLCGCEAEYTINIDDDYTENIIVTSTDQEEVNMLSSYNFAQPAFYRSTDFSEQGDYLDGVEYYSYEHKNNALYASYKFGDKFRDSRAINTCFPSLKVYKEKTELYKTDTNFLCFNYYPPLTKLTINIVTSRKVINHNADSVNGNTYTWIYTRDSGFKSIMLELKSKDDEGNTPGGNVTPSPTNNNKNSESKEKIIKKYNQKKHIRDMLVFSLIPLSFGLIFAIIIFRQSNK